MTSGFYFTTTSWFPGNVRVKPHSKHSAPLSPSFLWRVKKETGQKNHSPLWSILTFHCRSMFDECELELLLCGVSEYSLAELKKHNIIVLGLSSKLKIWFWMALSHFTPEQFARLLQFTTGSSQLPPGGFADLKPLFQIAPTHKQDSLPIAHTCFNMICLSDHSSFQSFEKALLTAINDGGEGFELAWYSNRLMINQLSTLKCLSSIRTQEKTFQLVFFSNDNIEDKLFSEFYFQLFLVFGIACCFCLICDLNMEIRF